MKISACMIAKNESRHIERCINSYKKYADEIIVVDTGSADDTAKKAEELGALVFFRKWDYDFSAARNYALEHATGDWIVFLDADEYFSEESAKNLRKIIINADKNKNIDALAVKIINLEKNGKNIGQAVTIRIFRNSAGIRYTGKIHEIPKKHGEFLKYEGISDILIYHTGYSSDVLESKLRRNLAILKTEAAERQDALIYYYLAETCHKLHEHEEAVKYSEAFLNCRNADEIIARMPHAFRIYRYVTGSMIALKYPAARIKEVLDNIHRNVLSHPEIKKCMGDFFYHFGRYDEALAQYLEAAEQNKKEILFYSNSFDAAYTFVLNRIGEIYLLRGERIAAFDYFLKAVKTEKYADYVLMNLLNMIKNQSLKEIVTFLNTVYDENDFEDIVFLAVNLAARKMREPFLYYFLKKWQGGYEDYGILMVNAMLFANNAEKALELAHSCYLQEKEEAYALLTSAAVLIGNCTGWLIKHKAELPEDHAKILDIYFKHDAGGIPFMYESLYIKILEEMILLEKWDIAERFIVLAKDEEFDEAIAAVFERNNYFEFAASYYEKAVERYESEGCGKNLHQKIAFCLYKSNQYEKSLKHCEQALADNKDEENGFVFQLIQWMLQKSNDSGIRMKCRDLMKRNENKSITAETPEEVKR